MQNAEFASRIPGIAARVWCGGRGVLYVAGMCGAVVLDAATPLGIADWLIELILVLVAATWGAAIEAVTVGTAATVAIGVGLWTSPVGPLPLWMSVLNRMLAIATIWVVVRVACARSAAAAGQVKAAAEVKVLRGLLPVCAVCKRIRSTGDQWHSIEAYISGHSEARFTHTYCPACAEQYLTDLAREAEPSPQG
jgi:hypothetical protein